MWLKYKLEHYAAIYTRETDLCLLGFVKLKKSDCQNKLKACIISLLYAKCECIGTGLSLAGCDSVVSSECWDYRCFLIS